MKKKMKKRTLVLIALSCVLVLLGVIGGIFWQNQQPQGAKEELLTGDAYGVLLLGSDEGATQTNGGNHTDSITYVAINKKTKKAYALPIYRDSLILNQCTGKAVNINHVYRESGATCLTKSVSSLLNLPVDYYIYITAKGFVDLFNTVGPLEITAEDSFCSNFGNDNKEYCFTDGNKETLSGNALLAYARYRGTHSGENRAMRHVQILNKGYEQCIAQTFVCGNAVLKNMQEHNIETDLPYEEVLASGAYTQLELLTTLNGINFEDGTGWHQRIDEADLAEKTSRIRNEIFV